MPTMDATRTLTFRELMPEEWHRVGRIEPFDTCGVPADNGHWRIVVAELDGEIVGCVSVHTQIHMDPWWIDARHPEVARGLANEALQLLAGLGALQAFVTIPDVKPHSDDLATRLGWEPVPGHLCIIDLADFRARLGLKGDD